MNEYKADSLNQIFKFGQITKALRWQRLLKFDTYLPK